MKNALVSIICCYRSTTAWEKVKAPLSVVPTDRIEFVGIDNRLNAHTLPEAYNKGKDQSNGEILVFVHDDVEFLNKEWVEEHEWSVEPILEDTQNEETIANTHTQVPEGSLKPSIRKLAF